MRSAQSDNNQGHNGHPESSRCFGFAEKGSDLRVEQGLGGKFDSLKKKTVKVSMGEYHINIRIHPANLGLVLGAVIIAELRSKMYTGIIAS